jgi:TolA-binding protein
MMKINSTAVMIMLYLVCASSLFAVDDKPYEYASDAYKRRDYAVARIYFENILNDGGNRQYFPDAQYYLTKIHQEKGDVVEFISSASRFLQSYSYDSRALEIFTLLIRKFMENRAYEVAVQYVQKYEFLVSDISTMEMLGRNLIEQGEYAMADYALSFCSPSDTIKIMRAIINSDYSEREKIFSTMQGANRSLYIAENCLLMGDTVKAYFVFRDMTAKNLTREDLYRYAKIALLFDRDNVGQHSGRLRKTKGFEQKADLLDIIAGRQPPMRFVPQDKEEIELYLQICNLDTISRNPPDGVVIDSILRDIVDTLAQVKELRNRYRGNYLLDSLHCQELIKRGDYSAASEVISAYLDYNNTPAFVLKTVGFGQYINRDFERAAKSIILSNNRSPFALYVLAECLRATDRSVPDLYEWVIAQTADSTLREKALRGYVLDRYHAGSYEEVCAVDFQSLMDDTSLIRLYTRSLARCGELGRADSVFYAYFENPDFELFNLYGEYLFDKKQYRNAMAYYDSIIGHVNGGSDGVYYNWALSAFYNNEMDTALYRFKYYADHFRKGSYFHDALFKIATLNYLREQYDSAAYYYGLAADDEDLMADALENQLISYKKAGDWPLVISAGWKIMGAIDKEEADVRFEIGYASLRAGKVNDAIENLQIASRLRQDPGYYYWLGEAYLGKGDFARAFHSYRKIADLYADDEMWAPTAHYKTAIVLELLDELDAAREVYKKIVRERGVNDPIGAEANARLKLITQ